MKGVGPPPAAPGKSGCNASNGDVPNGFFALALLLLRRKRGSRAD